MKRLITFITSWPAAALGLYALLSSNGSIRPEQQTDYQVGSGVVGLIAAILVTLAVGK